MPLLLFLYTICVERLHCLCCLPKISRFLPAVSFCTGSSDLCIEVSLGVLRSRLLLFVGDASLSFDAALTNLSAPSSNVDDPGEELGRDCGVTQDSSVRSLFKNRANFAPLPDQLQTLNHYACSSEGTACT